VVRHRFPVLDGTSRTAPVLDGTSRTAPVLDGTSRTAPVRTVSVVRHRFYDTGDSRASNLVFEPVNVIIMGTNHYGVVIHNHR
ncbi:MAG: hypothetical protein NT027_03965, partial [Proteobacteria bacterium]|nr:hypothetical protein [Pseudomonadota bacterium]